MAWTFSPWEVSAVAGYSIGDGGDVLAPCPMRGCLRMRWPKRRSRLRREAGIEIRCMEGRKKIAILHCEHPIVVALVCLFVCFSECCSKKVESQWMDGWQVNQENDGHAYEMGGSCYCVCV